VEVPLDPRPDPAKLVGELLVLEVDLRREAVAQPLRECRRRSAGRDRNRDRPAPVQRRQDERALLGDVGDVSENVARCRVREDTLALRGIRDDDEPDIVE